MDFIKTYDAIESVFDSHELYYHKERSKKFECKEREICGIEIKEEEGMALRAIKDQKMVFTYTYDPDNVSAALLKNSKTLLPFMERDEDRFFPVRQNSYPALAFYDDKGLKTDDA
jgi:predicted Zn-dependent protease